MNLNSYFAIEKPIRVFRHVGHSPSNTYVGASRAITTVKEAINARYGDVIHALVGGTFLVRDGEVFKISLRQPKPLLEKNYGIHISDKAFMEGYVKSGYAKEVSKSVGLSSQQYNEAGQKVSNNRLPELHQEIIHVEDSPFLARLKTVLFSSEEEAGEIGLPFSITGISDVGCDGGPKIQLSIGEERVLLEGGAAGIDDHVVSVSVSDRLNIDGEDRGLVRVNHGRKRVFFRTTDGVENPMAVAEDFLVDVVKAVALESRAVPTA